MALCRAFGQHLSLSVDGFVEKSSERMWIFLIQVSQVMSVYMLKERKKRSGHAHTRCDIKVYECGFILRLFGLVLFCSFCVCLMFGLKSRPFATTICYTVCHKNE